jgi:hypothetical protein
VFFESFTLVVRLVDKRRSVVTADLPLASDVPGRQPKLEVAVESALSNRCYDTAAVQHLLNAADLSHTVCEAIDVGALERYARPLPAMLEYDQLLTTAGGR